MSGREVRRRDARTRSRCLEPAGATLDDRLERAQADGRITVADADEVRRFGEYLELAAGLDSGAKARLYIELYPEHFPELQEDR